MYNKKPFISVIWLFSPSVEFGIIKVLSALSCGRPVVAHNTIETCTKNRIQIAMTWEANGLPYDYTIDNELAYGGVRAPRPTVII